MEKPSKDEKNKSAYHLAIIFVLSIMILPMIIQVISGIEYLLSSVIAGVISGLFVYIYSKIYENQENKIKTIITISHVLLLILLFVIVILNYNLEEIENNPYISNEGEYFKEIATLSMPITENTYTDQKYGFMINYPEKWEVLDLSKQQIEDVLGDVEIEEIENSHIISFSSTISSNEYFYPNFNIVVGQEVEKVLKKDLILVANLGTEELSNVLDYRLTSIEEKTIRDGDSLEVLGYYPESAYNPKMISKQMYILYKKRLYIITYTSSEEDFYNYLPEVESSIRTLR